MNFETIIGLLVLFFYVMPKILKKIRGTKTAGKPPVGQPPKQGLAARFAEKAQQVIKELEKQAAESRRNNSQGKEKGNPWDGLVGADDRGEPEEHEKPAPLVPVKAAETIKPIVPVTPLKKMTPAPPVSATDQPLTATMMTAATPDGLRNAVIWSEILSPPLALRDDR